MPEPSPAGDETFALDRADTVAVPDHAASDRQSWRATWRKAAALLIGGLALAGAIVLAFWLMSMNSKGQQQAQNGRLAPPPAAPVTPSASPAAPSPIASTPDQDNRYVQELNDHGISFANPGAAVHNGKVVCEDIRHGMTVPQIAAAFRASNPGLDADTYVTISVRAYCPQNDNLVGGGS